MAIQDKEPLLKELNEHIGRINRMATMNYTFAWLFAVTGVLGSIVATILSAAQIHAGWVTAVMAAIPGAVISIHNTFNFEKKALWHWRTTKLLKSLIRKLEYEKNPDLEAVSKDYSRIDQETFEGWMSFSNLSRDSDNSTRPDKTSATDISTK
jgi:hypothetical protein